MSDGIVVEEVAVVDRHVVEAMGRLVPQLSRSAPVPLGEQLHEIVSSPCTHLLLARDPTEGGQIVGTVTLAVFRIPTGVRAWIAANCGNARGSYDRAHFETIQGSRQSALPTPRLPDA